MTPGGNMAGLFGGDSRWVDYGQYAFEKPFKAIVTDVTLDPNGSGLFLYAWQPVLPDPGTGLPVVVPGGFGGDLVAGQFLAPATERNNAQLIPPFYADVRFRGVVNGQPWYEFDGPVSAGGVIFGPVTFTGGLTFPLTSGAPTSFAPPGAVAFDPTAGLLWISRGIQGGVFEWAAYCPCEEAIGGSGSGGGQSGTIATVCCPYTLLPTTVHVSFNNGGGSAVLTYNGSGEWRNVNGAPLCVPPLAIGTTIQFDCVDGAWALNGNFSATLVSTECNPLMVVFNLTAGPGVGAVVCTPNGVTGATQAIVTV